MGIPIKRYIDISTTALNASGSNRDYSALLFTDASMKETVPADYATIKANFAAGKVVELGKEDVTECFANALVTGFATKYFSVANELGVTPDVLKIVHYSGASTTTKKAAFDAVIKNESNFGSFAFTEIGADADVASSNQSLGRQYVYVCGDVAEDAEDSAGTVDGYIGTHFMLCGDAASTDDLGYVCGWIATRDYTRQNSAGTIDYHEFPTADATVDTDAGKTNWDALKVNYIGHVQQRGINRSFYQRGVNMDGMDLGVYCDSAWIQSEIEAGWINMALGAVKIPANNSGMLRVRAMIIDVAKRALYNGCILTAKPLTTTQETEINVFANDESAATSVETNGYYISTRLLQDDEAKWVCQYVLIYSKGDHIEKVVGQHLLV